MSHHDQVLADHLALHPEEDESTNAFQQQQEKMAHKLKKLQTYLNEKFSEHDELWKSINLSQIRLLFISHFYLCIIYISLKHFTVISSWFSLFLFCLAANFPLLTFYFITISSMNLAKSIILLFYKLCISE